MAKYCLDKLHPKKVSYYFDYQILKIIFANKRQ